MLSFPLGDPFGPGIVGLAAGLALNGVRQVQLARDLVAGDVFAAMLLHLFQR